MHPLARLVEDADQAATACPARVLGRAIEPALICQMLGLRACARMNVGVAGVVLLLHCGAHALAAPLSEHARLRAVQSERGSKFRIRDHTIQPLGGLTSCR